MIIIESQRSGYNEAKCWDQPCSSRSQSVCPGFHDHDNDIHDNHYQDNDRYDYDQSAGIERLQ